MTNAEAPKVEECDTCGMPLSGHGAECAGFKPAPAPEPCERGCTCGKHAFGKPYSAPEPKQGSEEPDLGCGECTVCIRCAMAQQKQVQALRAELDSAREEIARMQASRSSVCLGIEQRLNTERAAREKAEALLVEAMILMRGLHDAMGSGEPISFSAWRFSIERFQDRAALSKPEPGR